MAAIVMDGKALAAKIKEQVRLQVEQMERRPGMAMILVGGEPPPPRSTRRASGRTANSAASTTRHTVCPRTCPQKELLDVIHF